MLLACCADAFPALVHRYGDVNELTGDYSDALANSRFCLVLPGACGYVSVSGMPELHPA
jgi:hypothetical protein